MTAGGRQIVLHAIEHLSASALDRDTLHAIGILIRTLPPAPSGDAAASGDRR